MLVVFFLKAASTLKWNVGVQNRRRILTKLFIAHTLGVTSYMYGFFVHNFLKEEEEEEEDERKKERRRRRRRGKKKKEKRKKKKKERKKKERKKVPLFVCGQNAQLPKRPPVFVPFSINSRNWEESEQWFRP